MSEKEKKEIAEMVETAKMLAKHDPQGLAVAKAGLDALRTRCEIAQASKRDKEASESKKAG